MYPDVVIDLYHGNAFDIPALKGAGIQGIFHKCTQGLSFIDPSYAIRRSLSQGIFEWGGYHFLNYGQTGKAQADYYLKIMNPSESDALMLDWEAGDLQTAEQFVLEIYRLMGVWPLVYTGLFFANSTSWTNSSPLINCKLFMAYPGNYNAPVIPDLWAKNGKTWSLWQHTANTIGGIVYADRDYFNGQLVDLPAFFKSLCGKTQTITPVPKVMLNIPDHLQTGLTANRFRNDCGVACVQDLLDYYGLTFDTIDIMASKTSLARSDLGLTPLELVWLAGLYNLSLVTKSGVTSQDIVSELDAGHPCIVMAYDPLIPGMVPTGDHFFVARGYDDQYIYVNDPNQPVSTGSGFALLKTDLDNAIAHSGSNGTCVFTSSVGKPVVITGSPVSELTKIVNTPGTPPHNTLIVHTSPVLGQATWLMQNGTVVTIIDKTVVKVNSTPSNGFYQIATDDSSGLGNNWLLGTYLSDPSQPSVTKLNCTVNYQAGIFMHTRPDTQVSSRVVNATDGSYAGLNNGDPLVVISPPVNYIDPSGRTIPMYQIDPSTAPVGGYWVDGDLLSFQ